MDLFKTVENKLYMLPIRKVEVRNLEYKLEDLKDKDLLSVPKLDSLPTSIPYVTGSTVETNVIDLPNKIKDLENEIKLKKRQIEKIDNALQILNKEEMEIVELIYFKRYPATKVGEKLNLHEVTIRTKKKKIIEMIMPIMV